MNTYNEQAAKKLTVPELEEQIRKNLDEMVELHSRELKFFGEYYKNCDRKKHEALKCIKK